MNMVTDKGVMHILVLRGDRRWGGGWWLTYQSANVLLNFSF